MKDLVSLHQRDIDRLNELGLIPEGALICKDGVSDVDGEQMFVIHFNTSDEKRKAFHAIYD